MSPPWPLSRVVEGIYARTRPEGGCLVFTGARMYNGYGHISSRGTGFTTAHQAVARYYLGPCPEGMEVMHMCHRGHEGCVTASHLRYGTRQENAIHCRIVGRGPRQKLVPDQVRAIRKALEAGVSCPDLGREYGVTATAIWMIKHGKTYRWLD